MAIVQHKTYTNLDPVGWSATSSLSQVYPTRSAILGGMDDEMYGFGFVAIQKERYSSHMSMSKNETFHFLMNGRVVKGTFPFC